MKVCDKCGARADAEGVTLHEMLPKFNPTGPDPPTVDLCEWCLKACEKNFHAWLTSTDWPPTLIMEADAARLRELASNMGGPRADIGTNLRQIAARLEKGYEPEGDPRYAESIQESQGKVSG